MLTSLAVRTVVFVGAEPIDEIAFRNHILLWKYKRPKLAEPDPLTDGTAVVAGEVHHGTDVYHIRLRRKLTFVETAAFLFIRVKLRLDTDLVSFHIDFAVLVPVIRCYVFFGIDLSVIHKGNHVALFDAVAACLLSCAGVGDEIELEKIERGTLTDMASNTHLLLVHDLRVLFEFFCIVFHDEAPFIFAVRKGCSV